METISPLVIDLGANNTGILMPHFLAEAGLGSSASAGMVVHIPDDKLTFAQESRRAKRHQKRGLLRRKMAKRLFRLIMDRVFGFDVNAQPRQIRDALHHAFNNRGFSFTDEGLDRDAIDHPAATTFIRSHLSSFFPEDGTPLSTQLALLSSDLSAIKAMRSSEPFLWNRDEEKRNAADAAADSATKKTLLKGFHALKNFADSVVNSEINGHKPRAQYLENIAKDLACSSVLHDVWTKTGLSAEDAARLIGNVGNLQLRALRKYFNDEKMAGQGDGLWDSSRMASFFSRYVQSWHAKSVDEKRRKQSVQDAIAKHGSDIVGLWRTLDPVLSIPPMEDMNNRHPQKCASLLVDESVLAARMPKWAEISSRLLDAAFDPVFGAKVPPIRRFQALLDRAREHEPWHLRNLAFRDTEKPISARDAESLDRLQQAIGKPEAEQLLAYARDYYVEREAADHGDWSEAWPHRVLRLCGLNCPRKSKVMHLQMGILLRRPFTEQDVEQMRLVFSQRAIGRSTVCGIAEKAAVAQKTFGAAFKELLIAGRDKDIKTLLDASEAAYAVVAAHFGVDASSTDRFGKPFVLAQLYNLLETDSHGSSATCQGCSQDNARRSLPFDAETSHARRLPADSGRPFDGLLARILERQAYEVAKAKIDQMASLPPTGKVFMPIVLEQNNFEFALGLLSIRKKQIESARMKAKDRQAGIEEGEERTLGLWQEKTARIQGDSKGICPYTGNELAGHGQVDHVIPRSLSRDWGGVVYNTEANLIYCSTKGNTDNNAAIYDLARLHPNYLQAQFGTADCSAVAAEIRAQLPRLLADRQAITGFHGLSEADRRILRHALFVEDLRSDVLNALQQQKKARVNGTQKWFAKQLAQNLRQLAAARLPGIQLETRTYLVRAEDVHALRSTLVEAHPSLAKTQPQSAFSHVVDAAMAWATWLKMAPRAQELIPIPENSLDDPNWLRSLLPNAVHVHALASKSKARKSAPQSQSLFKDGIFGNRFLSFLVQKDGSAAVGFHPANSIAIAKKPEDAFALLRPYLRWESQPVAGDWTVWSAKARQEKRAFVFPVDKTPALDFLHKAAKENLAGEDACRADLLDALSYSVQKKKVRDAITKSTDLSKTILLQREEVVAPNEFEIKVDAKKPFGISGKLIHPAIASWKAIQDDELLVSRWGAALEEPDWDALYARHFPRLVAANAHRKVRKVFSLPVPVSPSGGFRIRRTAADGSPVWQTVESDGSAYDAFATTQGRPDWKQVRLSPRLLQSPRIHSLSARHRPENDEGLCRMDEWLPVVWNDAKADLLRVEIAPGTADRLYVRIQMSGQAFCNSFGQPDAMSMPPDWKCESWPLAIKGPRSHLFFEQVGDVVAFWYIANGAPAELRAAYADAYAAKHPHP